MAQFLSSYRKTLCLKVWHSAKRHALMLRVVLFIFMRCPDASIFPYKFCSAVVYLTLNNVKQLKLLKIDALLKFQFFCLVTFFKVSLGP